MAGGRKLISALLSGSTVAAVVAVSASPASAQAAAAQYAIASQPLAQALMQLSRQANVDIVASANLTRGRTAKSVAAGDVEGALRQMLAGSGLTYRMQGTRYIIQKIGDPGTSTTKTSEAPASRRPGTQQGQRIVQGSVVDEVTGAALKGALVEVAETGERTQTDGMGAFRLVRLPETGATISISYLGYASLTERIEGASPSSSVRFTLRAGADTDIVVTAYQSARAQALNQERTSDNVKTVVSSDLLGQFDGTTISEALRKSAGVSFQPDAVTGEGANVIVRGFAPELSTVTLNGARLPVGNGLDRSPALNNLLTESVSQVTINKTLLPSQDSSGTGALIEIETKGPLDRPREYYYLGVEGSRAGKGFLDQYMVSGTVSQTIGASGNFGLSASVQYREREVKNIAYDIGPGLRFGQFLPLGPNGELLVDPSQIDPDAMFPFDPEATEIYPTSIANNYNGAKLRDLAVTLSGQWNIGSSDLRLDYFRTRQKGSNFSRSQGLNLFTTYLPLPIEELGGQTRSALVWGDAFAGVGFPGNLVTAPRQQYGYSQGAKTSTDVLTFTGKTSMDRLTLNYEAGYTKGSQKTPDNVFLVVDPVGSDFFYRIDDSLLQPAALQNRVGGNIVSLFAPRLAGDRGYVAPLLTPQGFALFNDSANYDIAQAFLSSNVVGLNERISAKLSARYEFNNPIIKYIEAGGYYERSKSWSRLAGPRTDFAVVPGTTLADLGLEFGGESLSDVGLTSGFDVLSLASLRTFRSLLNGSNPLITSSTEDYDDRQGAISTIEKDMAAYVQAGMEFGRLDVHGGVRLQRTNVVGVNVTNPQIIDENGLYDFDFAAANASIGTLRGGGTDFLPRILVNYRFADNLIARAGFFTTIARPSLSQLNGAQAFILTLQPVNGPNFDRPMLQIIEGNPDLKPSVTKNFDLSFEYYDRDIGVAKLGFFYKDTSNLLFNNLNQGITDLDGVDLPDDPRFQNLPANIFIQGSRPENSPEKAYLWGVEASAEKRLTFLPGLLSGLGVYANYTYTKSSRTELFSLLSGDTVIARGVPYPFQPKYSGTAALTYSKGGLDANISYTKQARFLTAFRPQGLSEYRESISSLDMKLKYRFDLAGARMQVYFEGSDLLKGPSDADLSNSVGGVGTVPKIFTQANFFGGRVLRLGMSASF